ncbi:hypothetical protein Tco_1328022 [Tanacetum coccineum]
MTTASQGMSVEKIEQIVAKRVANAIEAIAIYESINQAKQRENKVAGNASNKRKWEGDYNGSFSQQQNKEHKGEERGKRGEEGGGEREGERGRGEERRGGGREERGQGEGKFRERESEEGRVGGERGEEEEDRERRSRVGRGDGGGGGVNGEDGRKREREREGWESRGVGEEGEGGGEGRWGEGGMGCECVVEGGGRGGRGGEEERRGGVRGGEEGIEKRRGGGEERREREGEVERGGKSRKGEKGGDEGVRGREGKELEREERGEEEREREGGRREREEKEREGERKRGEGVEVERGEEERVKGLPSVDSSLSLLVSPRSSVALCFGLSASALHSSLGCVLSLLLLFSALGAVWPLLFFYVRSLLASLSLNSRSRSNFLLLGGVVLLALFALTPLITVLRIHCALLDTLLLFFCCLSASLSYLRFCSRLLFGFLRRSSLSAPLLSTLSSLASFFLAPVCGDRTSFLLLFYCDSNSCGYVSSRLLSLSAAFCFVRSVSLARFSLSAFCLFLLFGHPACAFSLSVLSSRLVLFLLAYSTFYSGCSFFLLASRLFTVSSVDFSKLFSFLCRAVSTVVVLLSPQSSLILNFLLAASVLTFSALSTFPSLIFLLLFFFLLLVLALAGQLWSVAAGSRCPTVLYLYSCRYIGLPWLLVFLPVSCIDCLLFACLSLYLFSASLFSSALFVFISSRSLVLCSLSLVSWFDGCVVRLLASSGSRLRSSLSSSSSVFSCSVFLLTFSLYCVIYLPRLLASTFPTSTLDLLLSSLALFVVVHYTLDDFSVVLCLCCFSSPLPSTLISLFAPLCSLSHLLHHLACRFFAFVLSSPRLFLLICDLFSSSSLLVSCRYFPKLYCCSLFSSTA